MLDRCTIDSTKIRIVRVGTSLKAYLGATEIKDFGTFSGTAYLHFGVVQPAGRIMNLPRVSA